MGVEERMEKNVKLPLKGLLDFFSFVLGGPDIDPKIDRNVS